jgi:hypothetical protein
MTLKINKNNYSEPALEVAVLKVFLDDESLAWKFLTLSLKFLVGQINQTIILRKRE